MDPITLSTSGTGFQSPLIQPAQKTNINSHQNSLSGEISKIPVFSKEEFKQRIMELLAIGSRIISFFGSPTQIVGKVNVNAVFADDKKGSLQIIRAQFNQNDSYYSFTPEYPQFHCFERECYEQYGIRPIGHPWLKPIRYSDQRSGLIEEYPFYQLEGKEVHEVGVGPIHAGIIEPGHFRFMCFGEKIHHLEIQLGYQHRGVEALLLKQRAERLAPMIETIAGDTSIAHTWAYCLALENLCKFEANVELDMIRGIALELERIAMHLAGLAGMATDIAYLPGGSTYGRLRTAVINTSMRFCGNRFGRGWLRPGEVHSEFTSINIKEMEETLNLLQKDISEMNDLFTSSKTVLHRLKGTGQISSETVLKMGFVGMTARCANVSMDLRNQFPGALYQEIPIQTVVEVSGDCWARALLRMREIDESVHWLISALQFVKQRNLASDNSPFQLPKAIKAWEPSLNSFSIAMIEGWRGEVMHYIETNPEGKLGYYKVQDPSLRNWFALALAVRNNDISDFPICNKSFDLSYCGHDL
jgi:Ni,Fe-hydrogenase III large subunit